MSNFQLEGVLRLTDVNIDPSVFRKISRSVAGLPVNVNTTVKHLKAADSEAKNLNRSTKETAQNMSLMSRGARTFLQRMAQFAVLLPTFATLNKSIQGGARFLVDFEKQLANIVRIDIAGLSDRVSEIANRAFDIGAAFGASADEVVDTIRLFKQAGFTIEESFAKAEAATLAATVTTLTLANAQEALIAVTQQFGDLIKNDTDVIDKFAKVEDEAAVGAQDLAEALRTGGNALAFTTKSLDDTLGLISALREQTRKTGREVGTFFKTLATRITAAGESRNAVELLGVQVENLDGSLRPLLDILNDLKVSFDGLTEAQQANAAKAIAGVRQFEGLLGTLNNLDRANELSAITANAAGTAFEKQAIQSKTLAFQLNAAIAEFQKFAAAVGDAGALDIFKDVLSTVVQLTSAFGAFVKLAGDLGVALGPLALVGGIKAGQSIFGGKGDASSGIGDKALDSASKNTTQAIQGLGKASQQSSRIMSTADQFRAQIAKTVADAKIREAKATESTNKSLLRYITTLDRADGSTSTLGRESAKSAIKIAAFAVASSAITQAANGVAVTLRELGQDSAATGVEIAASSSQAGLAFSLLGKQAGVTAFALTSIVASVTEIIKAVKERNQELSKIDKNNTLDSQLAEFSRRVGEGGSLAIEVEKAFVNGIQAGSKDFRKVFTDSIESIARGESGLDRISGEDVGRVFNEEFIRSFAQARGFDEVTRVMDEAVRNGTSPLQAGLSEIIDSFQGFSDVVSLSKDEVAELARQQLLTSSASIQLASSIAKAGFEIQNFNQNAEISTARRAGPDRGLGDTSLEDASIAVTRSVEGVTIAMRQYDRIAQDLSQNQDKLNKAGFNSSEQMAEFISRIDEVSKKTGRLEVAAGLETLRQEFPTVAKAAFNSIVKSRGDIQKALEDQAKAQLNLEKVTARKTLDSAKARNEALEQERSKIAELTKEFSALGLGIDATSKDIADAFGGTDLQKAQMDLKNTVDSSAKNLASLSRELAELDAALEGLGKSGGTIDFDLGLKKEEIERKRAATALEIQVASIKSTIDEGKKLAEVRKEEAKEQEVLRKQAEAVAAATNKFNDALRNMDAVVEGVAKDFGGFVQESQAGLLDEETSARSNLASAQADVIDSSKGLADQFAQFQASIIGFNDAMSSAQIESNLLGRNIQIITGGITTFQGRLTSLNSSFNDVLRDANISIEQRIGLERQLAEETLGFLEQARSEIVSAGLNVFGQSNEENQNLREGISGLEGVAQKLGGSFENFLQMSGDGFNSLSNEILSLPVEVRQQMLNALQSLPSTANIGGFSVDQLREAIGAVGAGVAPDSGLPGLEDITDMQVKQLEKLQDVNIRSAELEASQVQIASEQLALAEQQLEVSKIQRDRAEQDLGLVRDGIIFQNAILQEGASLQNELTERAIRADSENALRIINEEAREFAETRSNQSEVGDRIVDAITKLSEAQRARLDAANNLSSVSSNSGGYIPNYARGNVTPSEAAGLIKAAQREKAAMPAGAGLAVANTSEAIIPMGGGKSIPNYATGSPIAAGVEAVRGVNDTVVAAITRSITQALSNINGSGDSSDELRRIEAILQESNIKLDEVVSSSTTINNTLENQSNAATNQQGSQSVDINLTTQQNGTVTVTGLENLRTELTNAVRETTDERITEALNPVFETLEAIVATLRDRNLISGFGQPR